MSDIVISAQKLSKRYLIGHQSAQRERYTALRDVLAREVRNFARKGLDLVRNRPIVEGDQLEEFWALRDVSFEVKRGEVLGIIGRNGAGKSTLLKILSRITEPDCGRAILRGRVASLLEVGTGFHPELTGRENIYLNGAILGMTRAEITRKFDEIVCFAEVERFLDTPVKRYSSGMYVRLAFAIAAHLEPDILIIDEVLAVGDAEFQKKCLAKMGNISKREGRTILFVSHDLAAIAALTNRAILLESGLVTLSGSSSETISGYLSGSTNSTIFVRSPSNKPNTPHVGKIEVVTSTKNGVHFFGESLEIKFWIVHEDSINKACFSFQIINQFQQPVIHAWALYPDVQFANKRGVTVLTCQFPALRLNIGTFYLRTNLTGPPNCEVYERLDGICKFEVVRTNEARLWGWHANDCAYHEFWNWTINMTSLPWSDDAEISE